jgi:hypothetical protein
MNGSPKRVTSPVLGCLFAALLLLNGCNSSNYVAPRVVGRVFDAETHQPLGGVEVRRLAEEQKPGPGEQRKGGQALMAPQPIHSSADGSFVLESQRALAFFRKIHWFSVELEFELDHYETFSTNYILGEASMAPHGEPVVQAGDILMQPLPK